MFYFKLLLLIFMTSNLYSQDKYLDTINYSKVKKLVKKDCFDLINFVKDRPGHDFRYALNSNKLRKNLNWKPKTNIVKGLENTFLWYLRNSKYYSNLKKKDIVKRIGLIK